MMLNLSSIAYTTQYLLAEKHLPKVKNSHLLEFLAALLGYGSYAAYKTETATYANNLHRPQYLILQPDFAIERCRNFFDAHASSDIAIDSLVTAIETDHARVQVYKDEMFFLEHLAEYAQDEVNQSDEIGRVMAETNFFYGGFEVDDTDIPFSLLNRDSSWQVNISGVINSEQNLDRMYNGQVTRANVLFYFEKAGRVGLSKPRVETSCDVTD